VNKRLFVGARVSVETANAIAACAEMLQRRAKDARPTIDMKWVAPANYHVTLKFLGPTRDDAIGAVRDALEKACIGAEPFKLRCARVGAFPSLDKASVVWAGAESDALGALAGKIDAAMEALGFARETRAFHGHVTISRLRETRPVRELVLPLAEQVFSESRIDGVTLFESVTKSSGPAYSELHRITFKRPESEQKRQTAALELDETDDGWPRGHSH
jgi:2'-5' RNA ligase